MGHEWYGGLCYADRLKLSCGKGIQRMLTVCEELGRECRVRLNTKMLYTRNKNRHLEQMQSIKLEGLLLAWVQSVNYLGTYITSNLSEDVEVGYK